MQRSALQHYTTKRYRPNFLLFKEINKSLKTLNINITTAKQTKASTPEFIILQNILDVTNVETIVASKIESFPQGLLICQTML